MTTNGDERTGWMRAIPYAEGQIFMVGVYFRPGEGEGDCQWFAEVFPRDEPQKTVVDLPVDAEVAERHPTEPEIEEIIRRATRQRPDML